MKVVGRMGSSGVSAKAPSPTPLDPDWWRSLIGLLASLALIFALPWLTGELFGLLGLEVTTLNVAILIVLCLALVAALVALELAASLPWSSPLRRIWASWDTIRHTALDSLVKPLAFVSALAAGAFVLMSIVLAPASAFAAVTAISPAPFLEGGGLRVAALAIAVAAAFVSLRHLSQYLLSGRSYLTQTLARYAASATLIAKTPLSTLRFYHRLLQLSGAVAFVCELLFQIITFGLVIWGLGVALPEAALFQDQNALTISNAILFWTDRTFALFDWQDTFGFALSSLVPNKAVWPLGAGIIFFKLFVVAMIIRLFQESVHLKPRDISKSWGDALDGRLPPDERL